jgi:hypothetical protein
MGRHGAHYAQVRRFVKGGGHAFLRGALNDCDWLTFWVGTVGTLGSL